MKSNMFSAEGVSYAILSALVVLSVVLRLIATSESHIIPGLGSMYYPLQVRCLLERGTTGYPDMPLVFWIEAVVAKILLLCSPLPVGAAIVTACRWVNAIIPSLIVVPVFYLARSLPGNRMHPALLAVVLSLSVLNPSVLVLFAVDFDKNAIGMLFVYFTLYYVWQYLLTKKIRYVQISALSVLFTLLTHFGCFSALFAFLLILTLTTGLLNRRILRSWFLASKARTVVVVYLLIALILLPGAVKLFDPQRFAHLASYFVSPLQLFRHSFFLSLLKGERMYDWPNLLYLGIINFFSVLGLIAWFRLRHRLEKGGSLFFLSVVLWLVLLSNPFLNTAIYNRLLFISLIPLTVVVLFTLHFFRRPVKISLAMILTLLLMLTVATSGVRRTYISKEEHTEMKQLGKYLTPRSSTILLAQHRLEFWTSWTLRVKSGQLQGLRPGEYDAYAQVLYLVQKSNAPYQEEIPRGSRQIYDGRYFTLYRIH